jgi:superfamily I DNA/RNA helicase
MEIILDRAALRDGDSARAALDRVFAYWSGDGTRDRPLSDEQLEAIDQVLEPDVLLRPLLPGDIEEGEHALLAPTNHQLTLLKTLRRERRACIEGGAGSGKTLLAIEKARQLATDGYNVLMVCFNQPLSKAFIEHPDLQPLIATGRLTVATFHELCRRLAAKAGVLPPKPKKVGPEWFSEVLPAALERAIPTVGGGWQAVVVDEGQDFERGWLESLDLLLAEPGEDVFYVFHDPAQTMFREDETAGLGLPEFPIEDNCRNARPIHEFAYRWYTGSLSPQPLRDDGREPEIIEAEPGKGTVDAVRQVLHRLVHVEGVARSRIAILTGMALSHSELWKQRRFKGDLVLWNGSVDDAGESKGLAADTVERQPNGTIAIETIHRFKGLERDVVVLAELRPDDERLGKLLYVGASRAKHHLVAVVPPELSQRIVTMGT